MESDDSHSLSSESYGMHSGENVDEDLVLEQDYLYFELQVEIIHLEDHVHPQIALYMKDITQIVQF